MTPHISFCSSGSLSSGESSHPAPYAGTLDGVCYRHSPSVRGERDAGEPGLNFPPSDPPAQSPQPRPCAVGAASAAPSGLRVCSSAEHRPSLLQGEGSSGSAVGTFSHLFSPRKVRRVGHRERRG